MYDSKYLPTYLAYSRLKSAQKDFTAAVKWLEKAEAINPKYAPIYVARADLLQAAFIAAQENPTTAGNPQLAHTTLSQQVAYLNRAFDLEDDYQELAAINSQLREVYRRNGLIADAILTASKYVNSAATVSTYLRDQRDDAVAYVASLKSELGYPEYVTVLQRLVEQKPQNYNYRALYADALAADKQYDKAITTLQQVQRILKATGNGNTGFDLQIAEFYNALGQKDSVTKYLATITPNTGGGRSGRGYDNFRYTRLLAAAGQTDKATHMSWTLPKGTDNAALSDYNYTLGKVQEATDDALAAKSYELAVQYNPYLFKVYPWLIRYYNNNGQTAKAEALKAGLKYLKIQPGPGL
jgi:tetratricopeptide (TPR) repeat protein